MLLEYEKTMLVDDLLYSQRSCSGSFRKGGQLDDLVRRLDGWEVEPGCLQVCERKTFSIKYVEEIFFFL